MEKLMLPWENKIIVGNFPCFHLSTMQVSWKDSFNESGQDNSKKRTENNLRQNNPG